MMKQHWISRSIAYILCLSAVLTLQTRVADAHCDTMNGPVVGAARKALETDNVKLVLVWVQPKDESAIRNAFKNTMAVRKLGPEAKKLADMYFFETLVRIHRAGEGVAYTGLKPADTKVDPGILAAEKAMDKGSAKDLLAALTREMQEGIEARFKSVMAKKSYNKEDLGAGRAYVQAYVTFIHYVEQLFQAAKRSAAEHAHGGAPSHETNSE